jgi:hypothetical protein
MHDDVHATNEVKLNQVPSNDIKSTLKKRVHVPMKIVDNSINSTETGRRFGKGQEC